MSALICRFDLNRQAKTKQNTRRVQIHEFEPAIHGDRRERYVKTADVTYSSNMETFIESISETMVPGYAALEAKLHSFATPLERGTQYLLDLYFGNFSKGVLTSVYVYLEAVDVAPLLFYLWDCGRPKMLFTSVDLRREESKGGA